MIHKNNTNAQEVKTMKNMLNLIADADRLHAVSMDDNVSEDAQDAAYIEYHKAVEQMPPPSRKSPEAR